MFECIGWLATATVAASYFFKQPATMRRIQALGALLWLSYGLLIGAAPIVGANVLVATLALYSSWPERPPRSAAPQLP